MTTIPLAAAAIVAIFAMGCGILIGWATRIRPEPEAEPTTETTIETRRRMNDA
jgi:hypothetical protein